MEHQNNIGDKKNAGDSKINRRTQTMRINPPGRWMKRKYKNLPLDYTREQQQERNSIVFVTNVSSKKNTI